MQGARINTLHELRDAANARRSVTVNHHHYAQRTPAAWLINIIGMQLCHYLDCGIYLYEPNPRLLKLSDRYKQPETPQETKLLENK